MLRQERDLTLNIEREFFERLHYRATARVRIALIIY